MNNLANALVSDGQASLEKTGPGVYGIVSGGSLLLEILSFSFSEEIYDLDKFEFGVFISDKAAESLVRRVKMSGESETLGYIFPILALGRDSFLVGEDKWHQVYADAAVRALVEAGVGSELLRKEVVGQADSVELLSLYNEALAVCVLGKEQLARNNLRLDYVRGMAPRYGCWPVAASSLGQLALSSDLAEARVIALPPMSTLIDKYGGQVSGLFANFRMASDPLSAFMSAYQILEIAMLEVFDEEMRDLASGAMTPWLIKESLQDRISEKWRLKQLLNRYISGRDLLRVKEPMKRACADFLSKVEPGHDLSNLELPESIYKARNFVVHRQSDVIERRAMSELQKVCELMPELCVVVLEGYGKPGADTIQEAS